MQGVQMAEKNAQHKPVTVEVELRSIITDDEFTELLHFFRKNAKHLGDDEQETWYLDAEEDVRIQRATSCSKIWAKKGKIHDVAREETELRFPADDFGKIAGITAALGIGVKVKWFRKRLSFDWNGVSVCLDDTKGYGKILELEMLVPPQDKEVALVRLQQCFEELDIIVTPREEFEKLFAFYCENWRSLTGSK